MESVGLGKVLPGAVNDGGCTFSQGYYENRAFIVYASGPNVIILTEQLEWVQTLSSASFGYSNVRTNCVHCAALGGKIAAGWGNNVVIFQPTSADGIGKTFPAIWQLCDTLSLASVVFSVCWKRSGTQLLVGGDSLSLWDSPIATAKKDIFLSSVGMRKVWSCRVASPIHYLKFSSDNQLFATAPLDSRQVKVWFKQKNAETDDCDETFSKELNYSFVYLNHPNVVTGFMWRKLSPLMPVGYVSNVLLTYCVDNVCRLWKHQVRSRRRTRYSRLRFHIAITISPNSDIPFRSTMPVRNAPFTVHWLDNKEMAYTRRAEKVRKGYSGILSHHPSISSLQSHEEESQNTPEGGWDYVESQFVRSDSLSEEFDSGVKSNSKYYSTYWSYNEFSALPKKAVVNIGRCSIPTKDFLRFLNDWSNSSDLLLCVHPNSGSLMIWTVEGLDSSPTCQRLAHVNFSSCLPHIFPPSDAFTLRQELLTFRHKPVLDAISPQDDGNVDGFLVIDNVNGPEAATSGKPSVEKTIDLASSLSVLSCHTNGSLNLWSVELGPLPFTSVSGLIHIAHISGHHSTITNVVKHPSLPIVVTTSSATDDPTDNRDGELIIWRSGQSGTYNVKGKFTELSRISSSHPNSFNHVAWFPVSCNISAKSHVPIGGIFITNVGNKLSLFESNFFSSYSINNTRRHSSLHSLDSFGKTVFSTSDISTFTGSNSLSFIGSLEEGFPSSKNGSISFMHVYPASCFPCHSRNEIGQVFYTLVLENVLPDSSETKLESYHSYAGIQTVIHLWQVNMVESTSSAPGSPQFASSYPPIGSWEKTTTFGVATVKSATSLTENFALRSTKILTESLNLPHGVYIEHCQSVCDVNTSNEFASFSSFSFASSCSDGILRFWKYKPAEDSVVNTDSKESSLKLYSWINDSAGIASGINFTTNISTFSPYSLASPIPATFMFANPGCVAVVFYLSAPPGDVAQLSALPNLQYALLTVWECVSSAGQEWTCSSKNVISCPAAAGTKGLKSSAILLEWVPVGNSQFLLACCFGSRLSVYSMVTANTAVASSTWLLLCSGNIMQSDVRLNAALLAYVGNSNLITATDCEFTIITLKAVSNKNLHFSIADAKDVIAHAAKDSYSILEEAYSSQSTLPEYHPQVLTDLISAGRLDLVKTILLNIAQYLVNEVATTVDSDTDSFGYDYDDDIDDVETDQRLLSVSSEGVIKRSKKAKLTDIKGTVPSLKLSQCRFVLESVTDPNLAASQNSGNDDNLFAASSFEEYVAFSDDYAKTVDMSQFSPQVAAKLVKVLQAHLLPGLTVAEQVCLVATIDTVANTRMSFSDQSGHQAFGKTTAASGSGGLATTLSSGAGYAIGSEIKGGGEAMDDCGLRYLLKLKNHILFQHSIPKGAKRDILPSQDFIWAFHSDAESDLLSSIPCVQLDKVSWPELRDAGVGWWLRSNDTLRRLIEKVAKAQFSDKQEPLDASLFYLALKKQNVLKLLFKNAGEERMTNFFKNDFTQHRWSTAALKNAFALLAKQRYEHAAAFFLLANKLWDAVEVCVSRLHDPQLGLVIVRLFEGDGGPTYNRFLMEHVLGIQCESKAELVPDSSPFLRSIAYWLIQDYSQSLETLLVTPANCTEDSDLATVFNFYFFLRSHPLLLRRKFADSDKSNLNSETHKYISSVGSEKLTSFERRLLFHSAGHYLKHGCPLVALDVLSKLPDENLLLGDDLMPDAVEQTKQIVTDMIQKGTILTPEPKKTTEDDTDWGQPIASQAVEDDFDWSKPLALPDNFDWSQPVALQVPSSSDSEDLGQFSAKGEEHLSSSEQKDVVEVSVTAGDSACLDVVTIYRQLKFDTCLTILCTNMLTLACSCSAKNLRETFREWLHMEFQEIESICYNSTKPKDDLLKRNHELISRLYWFVCHQSSKPSTLDHLKLELLFLLQDDIQGIDPVLDPYTETLCRQEVPNCILQPTKVPLLTCTMLPFAHPFSLAFYLKSLIQNIVDCISSCTFPIAVVTNKPKVTALPQLCEKLSNCVSLVIGCVPDDSKQRGKLESLVHSNLSKWPGVPNWPNLLPSDEGRDPVHISVLLAECLLVVYLGLLAHAWSEHQIVRLLYLTANCPSKEMWIKVFGGPLSLSKLSKRRTGSKSKAPKQQQHVGKAPTVFIPPRQTLVDAFTCKPSDSSFVNYTFPKEQKFVARNSISEPLPDEDNPFCYTWSLMNTGITKIVKDAAKSVLATAGMEVTELPVCSPLLHLAVKTLDSWEESFQSHLESFNGAPSELTYTNTRRGQGPALLQHKSILEPENSPFRSFSESGEMARKLWEYLIKQEDIREMFVHNLYSDKGISNNQDLSSIILYKDIDGEVATFCLNSANSTVIAAATSREILEINVTDILMSSDSYTITEEYCDVPGARQSLTPNYPSAVNEAEDFLVVHPARSPSQHNPFYSLGMDLQTGTSANMLLRRSHAGVKQLEAHPTLPYYLSGSHDGSINLWEFANAKPIVTHRSSGSGIMKIRFTQYGNKFGVADLTGRLLLWQGLDTSEKGPYQTLNCHVRTLYDFAFLSSSSFIATVGDSADNNNLCLWDTLLPERSALVHKYSCLETGASAVAHSPAQHLLVAGGKRGEISVFDIRHHVLLRTIPAHTSAINSIVLNDIENYFVTGSAEGEIKIWDLAKLSEIRTYSGEHNRSRLFRSEGGVMHLYLTNDNNLYSSGADGSLKCRTLVV